MPEKKFDKLEYNKVYNKQHTKMICIYLRIEQDSDIIEEISSAPNKTDYIRNLVRADIERKKQASKNSGAE